MDHVIEAPGAVISARSSVVPVKDRSREVERLRRMYAGVTAYVGLYYDRVLNSTKSVGLLRLYGRKATLGEVGGVALAELGAMGPERFEFACVLRIGEEDAADGGVSVRLDHRGLHRLVKKLQVMSAGPQWASPEQQQEAQKRTLDLLRKQRHHAAVLLDEETELYKAEPMYDLIGREVNGADFGRAAMWTLGHYDVATTVLVAALEIGDFEDGFNARLCHSQLVDFT